VVSIQLWSQIVLDPVSEWPRSLWQIWRWYIREQLWCSWLGGLLNENQRKSVLELLCQAHWRRSPWYNIWKDLRCSAPAAGEPAPRSTPVLWFVLSGTQITARGNRSWHRDELGSCYCSVCRTHLHDDVAGRPSPWWPPSFAVAPRRDHFTTYL
jgi:hypothetical protein